MVFSMDVAYFFEPCYGFYEDDTIRLTLEL